MKGFNGKFKIIIMNHKAVKAVEYQLKTLFCFVQVFPNSGTLVQTV